MSIFVSKLKNHIAISLSYFDSYTFSLFLFFFLHAVFSSFQIFRFFFHLSSFSSFLLPYPPCLYTFFHFSRYLCLFIPQFPPTSLCLSLHFPPIFPSSSLSCFFPLIPHRTQNVSCYRRQYMFWLCNISRQILHYHPVTNYALEFSRYFRRFRKIADGDY
jgi:hypothetical protein